MGGLDFFLQGVSVLDTSVNRSLLLLKVCIDICWVSALKVLCTVKSPLRGFLCLPYVPRSNNASPALWLIAGGCMMPKSKSESLISHCASRSVELVGLSIHLWVLWPVRTLNWFSWKKGVGGVGTMHLLDTRAVSCSSTVWLSFGIVPCVQLDRGFVRLLLKENRHFRLCMRQYITSSDLKYTGAVVAVAIWVPSP